MVITNKLLQYCYLKYNRLFLKGMGNSDYEIESSWFGVTESTCDLSLSKLTILLAILAFGVTIWNPGKA